MPAEGARVPRLRAGPRPPASPSEADLFDIAAHIRLTSGGEADSYDIAE
mgnify:CR=1 FL=1